MTTVYFFRTVLPVLCLEVEKKKEAGIRSTPYPNRFLVRLIRIQNSTIH